MSNKRVLISTIPLISGGIPQMVKFVTDCLIEKGYDPLVAYYQPYSLSPELSVPSFRLLQKKVRMKMNKTLNGYESYAIGAWLPELEFTHYLPTHFWKQLIKSCSYYITISGNCLPGLPYALTKRKFLAWIATPWREDRKNRVSFFPWYRKILDRTLNGNVIAILEKLILRKGKILALSSYTKQQFNALIHSEITHDVLPMPVDTTIFFPDVKKVIPGRIGFSGRLDDPRKNITLLLQAIKYCKDKGLNITADLIGNKPDAKLQAHVDYMGLTDSINFIPYIPHEELPLHLRILDVFVIPSHQEGLCIAGLEAMASGCPVISTRCGGPEEYVIEGQTGYLVNFDTESMGNAISKIVNDRNLRLRLSENARLFVKKHYNLSIAKEKFWEAFEKTFH